MTRTILFRNVLAVSFSLTSLLAMPGCFWRPDDGRGDLDHHDDHRDDRHDDHPVDHGDDHPHDNGGNR